MIEKIQDKVFTWIKNVPENIEQNIQFDAKPSNTLRSPLILRELISLNNVIITNILNNIVKWTVGVLRLNCKPESKSNHCGPGGVQENKKKIIRF